MTKWRQAFKNFELQPKALGRLISFLPFLSAFGLGLLLQLKMFPDLFIEPEMWAESATNFFYHAHFSDLWTNLWATDTGYLPWLPRVLALIMEATRVPLEDLPSAYQGCARVGGVFFSTVICLPFFRSVIRSDALRFLIAIALCTHADFELRTFINFSYIGAILYFLCLLTLHELNRLSKGVSLFLSLGLSLLAASKALMLSFLVPTLFVLGRAYHERLRRTFLIFCAPLVALFLQAAVVLEHRLTTPPPPSPFGRLSLALKAKQLLVFSFWELKSVLMGRNILSLTLPFWLNLLGYIALGSAIFGFYKRAQNDCFALRSYLSGGSTRECSVKRSDLLESSWLILMAVLVAGGNAAVLVGSGFSVTLPIKLAEIFGSLSAPHGRGPFISNAVTFLAFAIWVSKGWEIWYAKHHPASKWNWGWMAMVPWLFVTGEFPLHPLKKVDSTIGVVRYGEWKGMVAPLAGADRTKRKEVSFCVPIEPYPWLFARGCQYLKPPPPFAPLTTPFSNPGRSFFTSTSSLARSAGEKIKHSSAEPKEIVEAPDGQIIEKSEVSYVGLAFDPKQPPFGGEVNAYSRGGKFLGKGKKVSTHPSTFTFYQFDPPLYGISSITLDASLTSTSLSSKRFQGNAGEEKEPKMEIQEKDERKNSRERKVLEKKVRLLRAPDQNEPAWIWLGRPRPG